MLRDEHPEASPNYYISVLSMIVELVGKNRRVLDVGCSTGYISERLQANGCEVVGIEIVAESAQAARDYCSQVILANVEAIENIPYHERYFDLILFADVLEHLKDPFGVLVKMKRWLRWLSDEGHVVCSIPNMAHAYIRLKLLLGRWDYEEM
jgi:2-polyprenyl-3-methyl-5-hydroxy-6-metoxy-1,4-benzoquinol methylase